MTELEERERERRRRERLRQMKRKKQIQRRIRMVAPLVVVLLFGLMIFGVVKGVQKGITLHKDERAFEEAEMLAEREPVESPEKNSPKAGELPPSVTEASGEYYEEPYGSGSLAEHFERYEAKKDGNTKGFSEEEVISTYGILVDVDEAVIVSCKDPFTSINPASMTKVLTLLVAVENLREGDLDKTVRISSEVTYYAYRHDLSAVGFANEEEVTVRDLLYGTILSSGADAALSLAEYVAGSEEAFVEKMNHRLVEMGLSQTAHFTNCVGLYDKEHYCSVYDMAMIMEAAVNNSVCREVLSAKTYLTSLTPEHPEGILISNWFLRRIEDKDTGGEVLCAKTGFVVESGNCAVSYAVKDSGKTYICATANATSAWRAIYDHVALYNSVD